jgi:hypothetical protein
MSATPTAPIAELSDEEFETRTLDAIQREFGLGGLARFLMTYRSGKGDYTAERQERLGNVTVADITRRLKQREAEVGTNGS